MRVCIRREWPTGTVVQAVTVPAQTSGKPVQHTLLVESRRLRTRAPTSLLRFTVPLQPSVSFSMRSTPFMRQLKLRFLMPGVVGPDVRL